MITIKKVFVIIAMLVAQSTQAATYYIDAELGNDSWSGNLPSPSGGATVDGPWLTLAKIGTANLLPGDTVLLRCGQVWNDTLRLTASGTIAQPIRVGSYPTPCNNKPLIDGTVSIPSNAWGPSEGGAYRSEFPASLVANGKFNSGTSSWYTWSSDSSVRIGSDNVNCASGAAPCLAILGGNSSTQRWIASSSHLSVDAGRTYELNLSVRVPAGKTVKVLMRRSTPPWDALSGTSAVIGNNGWQAVNLSFRAGESMRDARFDIEGVGDAHVYLDNVSLVPAVGVPIGLYIGSAGHTIAHHPNRGHDTEAPESPYIIMASNANNVTTMNKTGSTYIPLNDDPTVPSPAELLAPGVSVFIRSAPWTLERKTITAVQQGKMLLNSPTAHPLRAGFGYFLTGARWMLDEPGEWLYDPLDRAIHLRTLDTAAPGSRVSVVHLQKGVDLSGRADIELNGLAIRRTGIGIDLSRSTRIAVIDCHIKDTVNEGLLAAASTNARIEKNHVLSTGLDAIRGLKDGFGLASGLQVLDNRIESSAVLIQNGRTLSLPVSAVAAISAGAGAIIDRNHIRDAAYHGITSWHGTSSNGNSIIRRNHINNACAVLDDCGGIYVSRRYSNSRIEDNVIRNLVGNIQGRPGGYPHAVGIYLDELSSGVTVARNTVENAEYGVQLHNAAHNRVDANILYANRRYQLWLHEQSRIIDAAGDIFGNTVTNNLIFPTGSALGVVQESAFSSTTRFASYDFNRYSALTSKQIARERWSNGESRYHFIEWQAAKTGNISRNLDPNGKQVTQVGYTDFQVQGRSLIAPMNMTSDISGWRAWSNAIPRATVSIDACGALPCLKMVAGASPSTLFTPNFSVEAGHWYRLTFDIKTKSDNQKVTLSPRRGGGGGNGYELFTHAAATIYGTTNWKRHALLIEAIRTINKDDPITGDAGARIDFHNIMPGEEITVANVEIVPLLAVGTAPRTALLTNPGAVETEAPCPDEEVAPGACDRYVSFAHGTTITWPHPLAPHSSEIVYTRETALVDSDGDGIGDIQDQCPETPGSSVANSIGCPFPLGS